MTPTIGRIVHFVAATDPSYQVTGNFHMAAVVTMTPSEWSPGYRDSSGEWHETASVRQPKPNTVHLHVFAPPTIDGPWAEPVDYMDVPYGELKADTPVTTAPGVWYWPPQI